MSRDGVSSRGGWFSSGVSALTDAIFPCLCTHVAEWMLLLYRITFKIRKEGRLFIIRDKNISQKPSRLLNISVVKTGPVLILRPVTGRGDWSCCDWHGLVMSSSLGWRQTTFPDHIATTRAPNKMNILLAGQMMRHGCGSDLPRRIYSYLVWSTRAIETFFVSITFFLSCLLTIPKIYLENVP